MVYCLQDALLLIEKLEEENKQMKSYIESLYSELEVLRLEKNDLKAKVLCVKKYKTMEEKLLLLKKKLNKDVKEGLYDPVFTPHSFYKDYYR